MADDAQGRCPTCGRPFPGPWKPRKVCALCKMPIRRGHKWQFTEDGRAVHRVCDDPESYNVGLKQ